MTVSVHGQLLWLDAVGQAASPNRQAANKAIIRRKGHANG
jgi:hypothetical protein